MPYSYNWQIIHVHLELSNFQDKQVLIGESESGITESSIK